MKATLLKNNGEYAIFQIKRYEKITKFYVDSEDVDLVIDRDFILRCESYRHINAIQTTRLIDSKSRQSLATLVMKVNKSTRVYMKDNFDNIKQNILDYRKRNLTLEQSEMNNYGNIMRKHVKHRENTLYNTNITLKQVNEIRYKYRNHGYILKELSTEYGLSITAISDIVTYRTWTDKNNPNLRIFKLDKYEIIENLKNNSRKLKYNYLPSEYMLYVIEDKNLIMYIEQLPIERLVYIEIRNIEKEFICSVDLYFPEKVAANAKENYIIGNIYPRKVSKNDIKEYIKILEYVL